MARPLPSPHPYDCILNGTGFMLTQSKEGVLSWRESRLEDLDPPVGRNDADAIYQTLPPAIEFPYAVTDLSGGFGLADQDPAQRDRYWYAEYADCSAGIACCGPRVQDVAVKAAGTPSQFIEFNGSLYIAAGRYLYKYNNGNPGNISSDNNAATDPPTPIKDFGAGKVIGQMAVFQGTQTAPFLFIPLGSSTNYQVMSTSEVFTDSSGCTPANQKATNFETVGDELWLANTESSIYVIRKATDGGTTATWGGTTTIGDPSSAITWLRAASDRLFVFKTNGLYAPTINGPTTYVDEEIAPHLRQFPLSTNGIGAVDWNGSLVFKHGHALYKYNPLDGEFQQFGPQQVEGHRSPLTGSVSAVAVQTGTALYALIYNGTNSYLMKYGSWKYVSTSDGPKRIFRPSWHGHLYTWPLQPAAMWTSYLFNSNQPQIFMAFTDGTVSWAYASKTAFPKDDPGMRFNSTSTCRVYYPRFTMNQPVEPKLIRALGGFGRDFTTNRKLTLEYGTALDGSTYTALGTEVTSVPGARVALSSAVSAKALDTRVQISTSGITTTPVLGSFVIYAAVQSQRLRLVTCEINMNDNAIDRVKKRLKTRVADRRTAAEAVGNSLTPITVVSPYGETLTVVGLGYEHVSDGFDEYGAPKSRTIVKMVTSA